MLINITTLPNGYRDYDDILLHSSFQVLVDFVDCHNPTDPEILELYNWWKSRKVDKYTVESVLKDNSMLLRLIKIRLSLWKPTSQ